MIGKADRPNLSAKAAETHGLLGFVVDCLERHRSKLATVSEAVKLQAELLLASGQAALRFDQILSENPRHMTQDALRSLMNSYLLHASLYDRSGGSYAPKHHLMVHCVQRALYLGNPRAYTTYRDESLNGVIAKIAATCHSAVFAESVHRKVSIVTQLGLSQAMH